MSLDDMDFNAEHDPDLMALISDQTPRRAAGLTGQRHFSARGADCR